MTNKNQLHCCDSASLTHRSQKHQLWPVFPGQIRLCPELYRLWLHDCLVRHLLFPIRSANRCGNYELCMRDLGRVDYLCDDMVVGWREERLC